MQKRGWVQQQQSKLVPRTQLNEQDLTPGDLWYSAPEGHKGFPDDDCPHFYSCHEVLAGSIPKTQLVLFLKGPPHLPGPARLGLSSVIKSQMREILL